MYFLDEIPVIGTNGRAIETTLMTAENAATGAASFAGSLDVPRRLQRNRLEPRKVFSAIRGE